VAYQFFKATIYVNSFQGLNFVIFVVSLDILVTVVDCHNTQIICVEKNNDIIIEKFRFKPFRFVADYVFKI